MTFATDDRVDTGKKEFDQTVIAYKKYFVNNMPSEETLIADLVEMLDVYKEYAELCLSPKVDITSQDEHCTGMFDSWEIISETLAIKDCDLSFFTHNGSGVPKEIRWFWNAGSLSNGCRVNFRFSFEGEEYSAHIEKESSTIGRTRLFWESNLGKKFAKYSSTGKVTDMIMAQPYHVLETTHQVVPNHKAKKTDAKTLKWIEKHPEQAMRVNGEIHVEKAMTVKKQVSYDTKENQLTKYILLSIARKLESFKKNYMRLQRKEDQKLIGEIDRMVKEINRRCNTTFLAEVDAKGTSSGMSLVFSMAPGYRDLYKYYLMLLHGLSITGDVFNISVKDLAILYEYWCFIKLNSMMKDRYQLISQDIVKVQGNGLFVSLVKGSSSKIKYRNPDNVLSLEKKAVNQAGKKVKYEYVFDAKYRVNPALEGSDYYNSISHKPGPEIDDINTMHRYRDAIVYQNGAEPYERTMFGAYVLFPYGNEDEYKDHKFFESIDKVNIGGLPFLPSATSMVQDMLDTLIADSPDSAFERATLPRGIEDKLAKIDWTQRDVLVGALKNKAQLEAALNKKFYHIPASRIKDSDLPIHYVAIYQSINIFGQEAGIRYYGEVTKTNFMKRYDIKQIPKNSDEDYYLFEIKEWKEMNIPLLPKEIRDFPFFTNLFLLQHCVNVPDLHIKSEEEYRLYTELRRMSSDISINENNNQAGFIYGDKVVTMANGNIFVTKDGLLINRISVETFMRKPREVMRIITNYYNK